MSGERMRPRVDFSSRRALATSSWDASGLTFAFALVLALRAVIAIVADVTVPVASGRGLVAALWNSSVGTIEVTALDVTVPDSLFGGLLDGGATGTPLVLDRNVTVVGGAGLPDMPILRLQATRALKLGRNVSLTFENVSLVTPSIDNLAWPPHLPLLQPSDPGSSAAVLLRRCVLFADSCNTPSPQSGASRAASLDALLAAVAAAKRGGQLPLDAPADLDVSLNQQPGCVGASTSSWEQPTVPILRRCWPAGINLFNYLGLPGQQPQQPQQAQQPQQDGAAGLPVQPTNYAFYLSRTYGICLRPLNGTPTPVAAIEVAASAGGSSSSSGSSSGSWTSGIGSSNMVGIIVGCVVGGTVAIALAAGLAVWRLRRRQQNSQQYVDALGGAGSSSGGCGGLCGKQQLSDASHMEEGLAAPRTPHGDGPGLQHSRGSGRQPHPLLGAAVPPHKQQQPAEAGGGTPRVEFQLQRLKGGPDAPVLGSSPFRPDLNIHLMYVASTASVAASGAATPVTTGGCDSPFHGGDAAGTGAGEPAAGAWAPQHMWVGACDPPVSPATAVASSGERGMAPQPSSCAEGGVAAGAARAPQHEQAPPPPPQQQPQPQEQPQGPARLPAQEQPQGPARPPALSSIPSITRVVTGELGRLRQHQGPAGAAGAAAAGEAGAGEGSPQTRVHSVGECVSAAEHLAPEAAAAAVSASAAAVGASAAAAAAAAAAVAAATLSVASRVGSTSSAATAGDVLTLLPVVRGRGSFGRVVEGMYRGERVAVKLLLSQGDGGASDDPAALMDAFRQEVEVLGRCSHPNVVKLLAACLDPRQPCLVMELCETSLEALVCKHEPGAAPTLLPLVTVLTIAIDICNALSYLHPTIIHRDLKPANVLINGGGGGAPVAKITDFGLARFRAMTMATQDPEAGTVAFMAPECFDIDNSIITHRADLYSLGVLLWVLVSGEQPWAGHAAMAVAYLVCAQGTRLPLAGLSEDRCPRKLRRILVDLWDADPLRRPAAAEVGKELLLLRDQLLRQGAGGAGRGGSGGPPASDTPKLY